MARTDGNRALDAALAAAHHFCVIRFTPARSFGTRALQFAFEFVCLVLPPLLVHTILSDFVLPFTIFLAFVCCLLWANPTAIRSSRHSVLWDFKTGEKKAKEGRWPRFLIFLLIGGARSLFIAVSGYFQDPIEYGTHWNFFLTLAVLQVSCPSFPDDRSSFRSPRSCSAVFYSLLLLCTSFEEWLLDVERPRAGILDANREGLCSLFGYFFIFGAAYLIAHFPTPRPELWTNGGPQSERRPTIAEGATLHSAISRRGGEFFLAANLLTGFLNYSRKLLDLETPVREFSSLLVYLLVLCLGARLVDSKFTKRKMK
ncbi:hypothetical protein M3Y99_00165700 [Aphelenchoides fujianensis]|nr:hypothetical protein M3Y99_00165700 [Aphelenchoides fujianensis]